MNKNEKTMIALSNFKDQCVESAQAGLDILLDGTFLENQPIVGSIVRLWNIGQSIIDALFIKKLYDFLVNLPKFTSKEKEEFIKKYKKDDEKFAETLFEILDKINDTNKCKYESNIFVAYYQGKIDYELFKKYSYALQILNESDIKYAENIINNIENFTEYVTDNSYSSRFFTCGMANILTYPGTCALSFNEETEKFLNIIK